MATLLIEKNTLNVWTHTPSDFQPYILTQFYAKSNGDNFSVFEFSGVQRGNYNFADISIKDGLNPVETGFSSIKQVMLRLEELLYPGFDFDGEVVPADLISTDPSNKLVTGTDNKLYVPDEGIDDTADHLKGNWNASTNTPTVANGVGQIGDYYVVTNGGTQVGILWGVGDIAAYNGATWYKLANNNQSPVLTTNTNITSSNLATQDVAGFVAYINALNPIITLLDYDIRTYTVTDTGQKFEILLRGRSFGFSEPAISESNVLEINDDTNYRISKWWAQGGTTATALSQQGLLIDYPLNYFGTKQNPATVIYTNTVITTIPRLVYRSAATAGSNCGMATGKDSVFPFSNFNRYKLRILFDTSDFASIATSRIAAGVYKQAGTSIGNVDPSTLLNVILLANDDADTNLHIMHNDGSGVCTKVDLGANFPHNTINCFYELILEQQITSSVKWTVKRWQNTPILGRPLYTASGVITSNLPALTGVMAWTVQRNNSATASAVEIGVSYVELKSVY